MFLLRKTRLENTDQQPEIATATSTNKDTDTNVPLTVDLPPKADFESCELLDASPTSDMSSNKSRGPAGVAGLRGDQGPARLSAPKQGTKVEKESRPFGAFGGRSPTETAGTMAKMGKTGTRDGSSKATTTTLSIKHKDQSLVHSVTTSIKSRIPKKSTSDSDAKSPVTPDKTVVPDISGSMVSPTTQKQDKSKEPLFKYPAVISKVFGKPPLDDSKLAKAQSTDGSPSKASTLTKHFKERKSEDQSSVKLVNGLQKSNEERTIVKAQPTEKENTDIKKQVEANVSTPSKSRLPISTPARKKSDGMTSSTRNKKSTTAEGESGSNNTSSQLISSEQQGAIKPEERIQSVEHESPEKGRKRKCLIHYMFVMFFIV